MGVGKERRTGRGRQYCIWIWLLMKRLWRQPAYVMLLVLIPVLGWVVGRMEQGEPGGAVVAVCVEKSAWSGEIVEALREQAADSSLRFVFHEEAVDVERSVMRSTADCGFVIGSDIDERVIGNDWAKCITVYETPSGSISGMAKERIGSVIFKLYSEQCYEEYMRLAAENMSDKAEDISAEADNIGVIEDETRAAAVQDKADEFVDFAKEAYERHLVDGSTFGFTYHGYDRYSQDTSDTNVISDTTVFPVKGVFAVIIFISGMCGMLEYDTDKSEKRFLRMAPNMLTYIVDIWISTVFVSLAVLLCLWISDGIRYGNDVEGISRLNGLLSVWGVGMWGRQIWNLFLYQCIVVIYCGVLGIILRRQEAVAAAIPVFAMGSLVCAPVFIRLATYVPVFGVLEKLFPVTYYLML
ncbi:MAG: hypothetical protein HDR17_13440 [Lachnospiraceae bacterium]|nr:hypothetical protein [Lachnospiraceae bacterium]